MMKPQYLLVLLTLSTVFTSCSKSELTDRERNELRGDVKEVLTVSFDIPVPLSKNPTVDYAIPNLRPSDSGSRLMRFDRDGRLSEQRDYFLEYHGFRYDSYSPEGRHGLSFYENEKGTQLWKTVYDEYGYPIEDVVNVNESDYDPLLNLLSLGLYNAISKAMDGPAEYRGGKMEISVDEQGRVVKADNGRHRYEYTYDDHGRVLTRRKSEYSHQRWKTNDSENNTYDATGLLRQTVGRRSGDSIQVFYEYDASNRCVKEEEFKIRDDSACFQRRSTYAYHGDDPVAETEDRVYHTGTEYHYRYLSYIAPDGDTVLRVQLNKDRLCDISAQSFEKRSRYIRNHNFSCKMDAELYQRDEKGRYMAILNEKDSVVSRYEYDAEGNATFSRDSVYSIYGFIKTRKTIDSYGRNIFTEVRLPDNRLFYTVNVAYDGEDRRNYVARSHFDIAINGMVYDEVSYVENGHMVRQQTVEKGDTVTTEYIYNIHNDDSIRITSGAVKETCDYEYDAHGNWTRRNTYNAEGRYTKVDFRFIQYY